MAFEAYLTQDKQKPTKGRRITYTVSAVLHGILLVIGTAYSFWHVDELSPPNVQVTFMSAMVAPPPPPPPPKKRTKPKPTPTIVQPTRPTLVQPKEEPEEEDEGDENGVEGGVPGGVVGGVVGNTEAPKFLPPAIGKNQLAINPLVDPYKVVLPPALSRAGMTFWAMVKLCVDAEGRVSETKILKPADPAVDPLILSKLKTWKFKPHTINGRPVPFCTNYRYEIATVGQ